MIKKISLLLLLLAVAFGVFAQNITVKGFVYDGDWGEPLLGVNIIYGPGLGTVTDLDGSFSLKLTPGKYTLEVSYVGFEKQFKAIEVVKNPIQLNFTLKTITLTEVQVVGDVAKTRDTPVAFSNINPVKMDEQLASQDIPLILNSTPGVYATKSGGGDGDARINIRGFSQRNVAVMLDGVPVNDMENGWVYWSNWFGLDAVMRSTQVQRGLGASKLAIPSVGGTINIATKGIDAKKGLSLKQEFGNDGFMRTTLGLTSGRMKNGWGVTFAGSYKRGDGWVDQTFTEGYFYFLRLDKEIGNHILSISAMGAPQEHGQRSHKRYIATFDTTFAKNNGVSSESIKTLITNGEPINMGLRYNPNWGYLSEATIRPTDTLYTAANPYSTANNFYHKPMFSLRDFWTVNKKVYISNILYLSLGDGGGNSFSTTPKYDQATGQQNLQTFYDANMNLRKPGWNLEKQSSQIYRAAMNNHFWMGLLSTVDYQYSDLLSFSGGADLRTYKGTHFRKISNLFGGNFFIDDGNKNEDNRTTRKYNDDIIGYHDDAKVNWGGLFGQVKLEKGALTAFLNLTTSITGYKRIDYFLPKLLDVGDTSLAIAYGSSVTYQGITYDHTSEGMRTNETDWKYIPGYTVKGGLNYNLNETMNVFGNLGYISKAQRFNNVFDRQNTLFKAIENEKVQAVELGYSWVKPKFTLNVNAYLTKWENKPADRALSMDIDGNRYSVNINNMNALHKGVELEFAYRITENLLIESLLSIGDWKWTSADTARVYDDNGQQIGTRPFDAKGLYVGDAAQIQNQETIRWEIKPGLYASGVFTYFGKHYAEFNPLDYNPLENAWAFDDDGKPIQSWKIPDYYMVELHAGYSWRMKKTGFEVRGSIINLLDGKFITDAQNNDPYLVHSSSFDASSAGVFFGMGRTATISLKITL